MESMISTGSAQAAPKERSENEQILLILVGLPGSGKTTLAEAIIQHFGGTTGPLDSGLNDTPRQWIRASQDDAPSRRRQECEALVRNGLKQGCNVIVDRVGFDAISHFINIADQHQPRPRVYALYLAVSIPTLEARLALRTSHPTIADPQTAMKVLGDMKRQLRPPTPNSGEGFDKIYTLAETEQPSDGVWTVDMITRVLHLVESEGEAETVPRRIIENRPASNYGGRGRGFDPSRGRGAWSDRGRGGGYRGRGGYQPAFGPQQTYPPSNGYPQTNGQYRPGPTFQPAPIAQYQGAWRARPEPQSHARDRTHPYSLPNNQSAPHHDVGPGPPA